VLAAYKVVFGLVTLSNFLVSIKMLSLHQTKACCMVGAVPKFYSIIHTARKKKKLTSLKQEIVKAEFS